MIDESKMTVTLPKAEYDALCKRAESVTPETRRVQSIRMLEVVVELLRGKNEFSAVEGLQSMRSQMIHRMSEV